MNPNENETMNVTIEAVEEENDSIETCTVVTPELVTLLAKIAVRTDAKSQKRRPLYNLLGVFIVAASLYFAYTYFITKTNTERGPAIIAIMLVMAGILFWYVNQPLQQFMENRMKPFLGMQWYYSVSEEGVSLTLNNQISTFQWEEIRGWWKEDGYYLMDISGQSIALKADSLDEDETERLLSLMYIYLGNEMTVEG